MSDDGTAAPSDGEPTRLQRSQAARRQRVLEATFVLACEGGYDAVQMRDVAARADVSLATLYKYYASKDALLAALLVEWLRIFEEHALTLDHAGSTPAERMVAVVDDLFRVIDEVPKLLAAVVQAMVVGGPEVTALQSASNDLFSGLATALFPPDFDPELAEELGMIVAYELFAVLVGWVSGWPGAEEPQRRVERTIHLLLDQFA